MHISSRTIKTQALRSLEREIVMNVNLKHVIVGVGAFILIALGSFTLVSEGAVDASGWFNFGAKKVAPFKFQEGVEYRLLTIQPDQFTVDGGAKVKGTWFTLATTERNKLGFINDERIMGGTLIIDQSLPEGTMVASRRYVPALMMNGNEVRSPISYQEVRYNPPRP